MGEKRTEACGRCAMSSVVSVAGDGGNDDARGDGARGDGARGDRDPFGSNRIEVDEADLRRVSPSAWLGGVRRRLDRIATRLTYGR